MAALFCRKCTTGLDSPGVVPLVCPTCEQETSWTRTPLGPWPVAFNLTVNDRKFLKSIRVSAE